MNHGIAIDAAEQLRRWDAGEIVWSVEMGGLGPGYEQVIQICAIEIIRDWLGKHLPEKISTSDMASATVERIDYKLPDGSWTLGFSGAQVGAAAQIAYKFLSEGPQAALSQVEDDRRIQVSKNFPKTPEPQEVAQ
jgi:hypothetical protein